MSISFIGGYWSQSDPFVRHYFVHSDDGETVEYWLARDGWTATDNTYAMKYVRSTKIWSDAGPGNPFRFNSIDDFATSTLTLYNPEYVFGYNSDDVLHLSFQNPHWQPPPEEPATGTEGDVFTAAMTDIFFEYGSYASSMYLRAEEVAAPIVLYKLAYVSNGAWIGNDANISYNKSTKTWTRFGPTNLWPDVMNSINDTETATTSVVNPHTLFGFYSTSWNPLVFAFANPWYEAPPPSPPPSPIVVPRSARRGNLNFW